VTLTHAPAPFALYDATTYHSWQSGPRI